MSLCQEDQEELSPSPTEEPWPKKFPEPLSWRSDEEDEDSDFGEEQRDRYVKVWFSRLLYFLIKANITPENTVIQPFCFLFFLQVSLSAEHQEFFIFLQRLLSPVLEAYSGAAIFVHSLSQPMAESDYTQRLFRYLLTRTERGVAAYGNKATFLKTYKPILTTHFKIAPFSTETLTCIFKVCLLSANMVNIIMIVLLKDDSCK